MSFSRPGGLIRPTRPGFVRPTTRPGSNELPGTYGTSSSGSDGTSRRPFSPKSDGGTSDGGGGDSGRSGIGGGFSPTPKTSSTSSDKDDGDKKKDDTKPKYTIAGFPFHRPSIDKKPSPFGKDKDKVRDSPKQKKS